MLIDPRRNLPPDVEALFTKTPPIKDVIEFALGDNGAYFISFRDDDGQTYCRHYNLPNPLTEYLYHSHPQVIRDLATLSICIGPYDSYYAHDKSSASWSNLPPALEKAVLSRLESQDPWKCVWKQGGQEAPSFVSLGSDGSFFMRTVSGGGSWDLKSKAEGMQGTNKFLEDSPNFQGIAVRITIFQWKAKKLNQLYQGLHLFPHHPNSYVMILTSGKAFSNLPEHTWADYNKMAPALPPTVQTSAPIPPVPQARPTSTPQQPQPQMQPQTQQQFAPQQQGVITNAGCCPPAPSHNCCPQGPQTPVYTTSYPPTYYQAQGRAQYRSPNGQFTYG